MKKLTLLFIAATLIACAGKDDITEDDSNDDNDKIVGSWRLVLNSDSDFDSVIYTFGSNGLLNILFDGVNTQGEWSAPFVGGYALTYKKSPNSDTFSHFFGSNFSNSHSSLYLLCGQADNSLGECSDIGELIRQ